MKETPSIELRNVSKRFGSVIANKNVNLTVRRGEILSILGDYAYEYDLGNLFP